MTHTPAERLISESVFSTRTIAASQVTGLTEVIQDAVAALLVAGTGVTLTYDDTANTLTMTTSGAAPTSVPTVVTAPLIGGSAQVGVTLSVTQGTWTGSPTSYTHQWKANGTNITGATGVTFVLTSTQVGATITVAETAINSGGPSVASISAATPAVIAAAVPVNTAVPTIIGTAKVGTLLSSTNGTWTNSPTSFTRQWRANGTNITGATGTTYTPVTGDLTKTIQLAVIASNASGPSASAAVSAATAAVVAASGATRHNVQDYANMQAALDAGVALLIPAGTTVDYSGSLLIDSGTDLQVEGTLRKTNVGGSGTTASFIRNRDFAAKIADVSIFGSGIIKAQSTTQTGNLFALYGDRMLFDSFRITAWAGGRAMVLDGNDITCQYLDVSGSPQSSGNGGIRVVGGARFIGRQLHVISGDDCLQFVPGGSSADPLYDHSISDGQYIDCTGQSTGARFIVIAIQHADLTDATIDMTCSVTNVSWTNCVGYGGIRAMVHQNLHSSGVVDGVFASGSIDQSLTTAAVLAQEVLVTATANSGGVANIDTRTLPILNPRTGINTISGKTTNIRLWPMA